MPEIRRLQPGELYSGAIVHGDTVYLAGKVARDASLDVKGQTRDILEQIDQALAACGSDKSKLLSVQIWLADIASWADMNRVWLAWVDVNAKPCRATVEAALARPELLVEIMCVAAR